jgi:hypothetical protein
VRAWCADRGRWANSPPVEPLAGTERGLPEASPRGSRSDQSRSSCCVVTAEPWPIARRGCHELCKLHATCRTRTAAPLSSPAPGTAAASNRQSQPSWNAPGPPGPAASRPTASAHRGSTSLPSTSQAVDGPAV